MTPDKMKQAFEQCLAALVENAPYDMAIELTRDILRSALDEAEKDHNV